MRFFSTDADTFSTVISLDELAFYHDEMSPYIPDMISCLDIHVVTLDF